MQIKHLHTIPQHHSITKTITNLTRPDDDSFAHLNDPLPMIVLITEESPKNDS